MPPLDESLILEGDVDLGEQVRFEMNNKKIRIPGFIVPVDFGDTQVVTRFLLVPYFGACIHEPAPPPNQTIYAEFEPGFSKGSPLGQLVFSLGKLQDTIGHYRRSMIFQGYQPLSKRVPLG